ncbi:MAG: hypothetical protein ABR517_06130 [Thermoanaerobaculia bacterium]
MRNLAIVIFAMAVAAAATAATAPLFSSANESRWEVQQGGKAAGTVTLLTDGRSSRTEWSSGQGAPTVFIATDGKIWVRASGGDVAMNDWKGEGKQVIPALLLPTTSTPRDKVDLAGGHPRSYAFGDSVAAYRWDEIGPVTIEVKSGAQTWSLTRKSAVKASADPSLYEVRAKKGGLSRLARLSDNLLGPADTSVSATAGGRGVEKGARFKDGGDYDALAAVETTDDEIDASLETELTAFQKEGKVGRNQGGSR